MINFKIQSLDIRIQNSDIYVIKNNKPLYVNNIVKNACIYGHPYVLNWYSKSHKLKYCARDIYYACEYGNLNILEWFEQSEYKFKINKNAILIAVKKNRYDIIKWILRHHKNHINGAKYQIVDTAIFNNNLKIIILLKKFFRDEDVLNYSVKYNKLNILNWTLNTYKFKLSKISWAINTRATSLKILFFIFNKYGLKKLIKRGRVRTCRRHNAYRFKSKNKYFKGYKKN